MTDRRIVWTCARRPEDRLDLREGGVDSPHPPRFELHQGAATALGSTPQDTRVVGIDHGQLLRGGIRRQDPGVGKATILGDMEDQCIDLVHTVFAQSGKGPRNVGMVANLGAGIVLAPNEHPRHDILGEIRFHLAGVHMLHAHQDHQGDIQRHIPG